LLYAGAAQWAEWTFDELEGSTQATQLHVAWHGSERLVASLTKTSISQWTLMAIAAPLAAAATDVSQAAGYGQLVRDALEQSFNVQHIKVLADGLQKWRQSYFHYAPIRQASGRKVPFNSTPNLLPDGSNLAFVLQDIRNNRPDAWRRLLEAIQSIVPGVGELMMPSAAADFEVAFRDPHIEPQFLHNLKDLGTGVEQLLMALVVGLTADAATVVLEEPEMGLHPAAQRALLGFLQEWSSSDRLYIASTHSPVLLDWSTATVLSVTREGAVSRVEQVSEQRADVLRGLGVRLSDVLAAERILLLEGPSDEQLFRQWFPEIIRDPRVAVIATGGGDWARQVDMVAEWLDKADQIGGRKLLFVRDRDELPQHLLDRLTQSGRVFVLPCRELENLLLDWDAIAVTIAKLSDGAAQPTAEEIAKVAREAADHVKQDVVLKRVCRNLEPLRLMDNHLRAKLTRSKAGLTELAEAVVKRVPTRPELRKQLRVDWTAQQASVEREWEVRWNELAPGEEVLQALWLKYLSRGYNKTIDGLELARLAGPGQAVLEAIQTFKA
jgi:hypothetical protein